MTNVRNKASVAIASGLFGMLLAASVVSSQAHAANVSGLGGEPNDIVCYVGAGEHLRLNAVIQLSDGTLVLAGGADSVDCLPPTIKKKQIQGAPPAGDPGKHVAFLLHASADFSKLLHAVVFPPGSCADVMYLKTTNAPGEKTGTLYISGHNVWPEKTKGKPGYYIAQLDANFVDGCPSRMVWVKNVVAGGGLENTQPWDVGGDGKVVYGAGEPHSYDWLSVERLTADGQDDVVPQWRTHWFKKEGGGQEEWAGAPASSAPGKVFHSAIVLKTWGRGDFRSWTKEDFLLKTLDGNGGVKQGRWPLDAMFDGYYDPATKKTAAVLTTGRGYYGYRYGGSPCTGLGAIAVDRRTGDIYIGGNNKSVLPDRNPDFEPWVVAMARDGALKWWQRLYSEEKGVSTPDQFIDALAIDYRHPTAAGSLVVVARAHGNNVNNFWRGDQVKAPGNPGHALQSGFTGSNGNMHYCWLGRLAPSDGTLLACTYVGEYAEGTKYGDKPFADPRLSDWPRFDSGWPDLNTTRLEPTLQIDDAGNVYIVGVGRRVVTTKNAYLAMPSPLREPRAVGNWSHFVRVYNADFTSLQYSSLVCGPWDWMTGKGGSDINAKGVFPLTGGLAVVGYSEPPADGDHGAADMPSRNVPAWGSSKRAGESGIIGILHFKPQ